MAKKDTWQVSDGAIHDGKGILYDFLNDWLSKEGQQILCDLMNEGWDTKPFDEVEPVLRQRLIADAGPDLLAACEHSMDILVAAGIQDGKLYRQLQAAIAKAKGNPNE